MLKLKSKSTKGVIGVDVSSTTVKMLQLSEKSGKYHIEAYASIPLAENDVIDKTIVQVENVGDVIERAYNRANPSTKGVAMAVPAAAAITKIIEMDVDMNDEEREVQIRMDAEQYIPYPLDEVSLDFEVLKRVDRNPSRVEVLLVATRTENVEKRVEALELAGLKPKVMDVDSYALERTFELIKDSLPIGSNLVGILDIGHTQMTLSVLDSGQVVYTREQGFGGRQLTQEIQQRYGLAFDRAEAVKRDHDLPDDYDTEVFYPYVEALTQQAARALQFFFSSSKYSEIDHLLLAGGGANLRGLPKLLQENLGYRVTLANPFIRMTHASQVDIVQLEKDASSLLIACGLALRSFD